MDVNNNIVYKVSISTVIFSQSFPTGHSCWT
jgi:hypothetical protein